MSQPQLNGPASWSIFGETVCGAAHARKSQPNQDALDWFPRAPGRTGPPLVCAVADGHGSPKCFRSALGAVFATSRAKEVARRFLKNYPSLPDALMKVALAERLADELVQAWRARVERDLEEHPLLPDELDFLEQTAGTEARRQVLTNPYLAYGATLLLALLTERGLALLQLGDGDMLLVGVDGSAWRPLPKDPRLMANETTSLCTPSVWRDFRTLWLPLVAEQPAPALLLLSTDGYANSFHSDGGFLQAGAELLGLMRSAGPRSICRGLGNWLNEASRLGSGDDITLAVLYRCDAIQPGQECGVVPCAELEMGEEPAAERKMDS